MEDSTKDHGACASKQRAKRVVHPAERATRSCSMLEILVFSALEHEMKQCRLLPLRTAPKPAGCAGSRQNPNTAAQQSKMMVRIACRKCGMSLQMANRTFQVHDRYKPRCDFPVQAVNICSARGTRGVRDVPCSCCRRLRPLAPQRQGPLKPNQP